MTIKFVLKKSSDSKFEELFIHHVICRIVDNNVRDLYNYVLEGNDIDFDFRLV